MVAVLEGEKMLAAGVQVALVVAVQRGLVEVEGLVEAVQRGLVVAGDACDQSLW